MSGMNGLVWVFSIVLAVVFVAVGVTRAYCFELAKKTWPWVSDLPQRLWSGPSDWWSGSAAWG